ncbi:uncharacterized protein LOC113229590 [Hyposmocoma kahamanoa]|uniref:uncharacterized protein LOC113229590 n=1 Tax=Hyposmocoma kahamanoa TaxID=1477025 RepID=UPI000E6D98EC|nr:uncharacterized protein LOC113229590 [Hyposmocoma kahamanoa]
MDNINVLTKTGYNVSKIRTECIKCKKIDSDTSVSYTSAMSSFLQPELLSSAKNIELLAQVKRQVNKSSDSGNSSDHDNSDYLIQFPKCVVETCIKDVLNLGTKINVPKRSSSVEKYSTPKMKLKIQNEESSRKGIQPGQIYKCFNCEKCSSKSNLKSERYTCNCAACLSCELCINKDSYLKKTEETQTLAKAIDKDISTVHCANHIACLDISTEDISSRPFKLSLVDVQNQNSIFSTNNCNFPVTTADKTKNVLFNQLYDNNNVLFTPVIDHSIENTIQGARQFSMKLLELLHKYQKANREFESITEKLKMAQDATISGNNYFNLDSYTQRFEEPEKDEVLFNENEHSNASFIDNRDTPIKVYPTCYAANIQKYKRSSKLFDNNEELLIPHDNKGNCPMSTKEFLLNDYFRANTPNLDIISKVKLTNTFSTYRAYRKLIKKAFRTTRRSNIRKKVPRSSAYKINNAFESKMISTKSQTEAFSGLKCGVDIEYRSFRNIEVQFDEMSKEENVTCKKGNMDFKEDFESQYIQEKVSSINFIRSPYETKSNSTSTNLRETSTGIQVSEPIVVEEWNSCGHEALLKLQKEVDDLLQMSLLSSHSLDLSLKEQKDSVHSETHLNMNVEGHIDCASVVEENNLRVPAVINYEQHAPVLKSIPVVEEKDTRTSLMNGKYRSTPDVDVNNVQVVQHAASGMPAYIECMQNVNKRARSTPVVQETKQYVPVPGESQRFVKFLEDEDHQKPLVNNEDHQKQLKQKEQSSIVLSSAKDWKLVYDSKKVTFPRISKFSDHTIMVKWRIPECIDGVKGYELLADGRAIEKIFNPTRNMAVVTCMPHTHSDKIQVTIKTLLSKLHPGAQLPSVTTVYYPRTK